MAHVPSAFKRWWNILFAEAGGAGVSESTINDLPTANSFHPGDRLLVLKGTSERTIRGTCSGLSSDPNATIINDFSVSVDAGLNAVDFATAIVAALNTPSNLAQMGASDITDNGDGTFDIDFYPGIAANSYLATGTDNNPSFTELNPGTSAFEQVDETKIVGGLQTTVNKSTNIANDTGSDTKYPSVKAVEDFVLNEFAQFDSKPQVAYASTSPLPANTYANGASGVGATLTGNANGPLVVDGVTILVGQVGERILVAGESVSANNGWYVITQQGVALVSKYILTRAAESNQAAEIGSGYLTSVIAPNGVTAGSANNGKVFISVAAADPFVVGTTALVFSVAGTGTTTPGTGIVLLSSTLINLRDLTAAKQPMFTCPSGRNCIVTNIVLHKLSGNAGSALVSFGWNTGANDLTGGSSVAINSFINDFTTQIANLNIASQGGDFALVNPMAFGTPGSILGAVNATPEPTPHTVIADVFGYLVDATSGVPQANILT